MPSKLETTHTVVEHKLILYRRERSSIWQCRIKVGNKWQRRTTKERDLDAAREKALELLVEAKIRHDNKLPTITRRFRDIARAAILRMQDELQNGTGKSSYNEYILIIERYLIPVLGKRLITNIDDEALRELSKRRAEIMGKTPKRSTLNSHNAALNKVFDEAVAKGFLSSAERPDLKTSGEKSQRHASFEVDELVHMRDEFPAWIERARNKKSKELRLLLRDYVDVLLDTGARPGKELLNLKWTQIRLKLEQSPNEKEWVLDEEIIGEVAPDSIDTEALTSEIKDRLHRPKLLRHTFMTVTGKTGTREILGTDETRQALTRIARRNYGKDAGSVLKPFENLIRDTRSGYVFRISNQKAPTSFSKLFDSYIDEIGLKYCKSTGRKRVLYSLRHTYATLRLTFDAVPIHTLATQMGTSVQMIEKHYSHLQVYSARLQLQSSKTQQELARYKQTTIEQLREQEG